MKLSLRSEHALLSLICLARQRRRAAIPLDTMAAVQEISAGVLKEILDVLAMARYVESSDSGYRLVQRADRISVAEVIRLFDGALAPHEPISEKGYAAAPMDSEPKLSDLFTRIQDDVSARLERTSIADIA